MKKVLPYIWKGLGLLVLIVGGLFVSNMIQEKRMVSAMKKKAAADAAGAGKVVAEQATNGFSQKVR